MVKKAEAQLSLTPEMIQVIDSHLGVKPDINAINSVIDQHLAEPKPKDSLNTSIATAGLAGLGEKANEISEVPAAANREAIRANPMLGLAGPFANVIASTGVAGEDARSAMIRGSNNPEQSQSFQAEFIDKAINSFGGPSTNVAINFAKGLPGSIAGIAADIATNPFDMLAEVVTFGIGKIAKGAKAQKAIKTDPELIKAQNIQKVVDDSYTKAVRPTVAGKKSRAKMAQSKTDSSLAVDTIIDNKQNLKFTDEMGNTVSGRLPENLDEFSQAINQTKQDVFRTYSSLQQQSGNEMRLVFLDDIADELVKGVDNAQVQDLAPEAYREAMELADTMRKRGFYTVEEANKAIEILNNQLKSFYKAPDPRLIQKQPVNAMVANMLRKKLDNVIQETTDKAYQPLKRRYGALRAIEEDVNKRLLVNQRKNPRGFFDLADIYTGSQLAEGILFQNPYSFTKGAVGGAIKGVTKHLNNPDRMIRNMFRVSEKIKKSNPKSAKKIANKYLNLDKGAVALGTLPKQIRDSVEN